MRKNIKHSINLKRYIVTLLSFAMICGGYAQQQFKMTGKVTDDSGEEVAGAVVMVKGSSRGATTNEKGNYLISVQKGETVRISFVGYNTEEFTVGDKEVVDVKLTAVNNQLGDLVVVGYGVTRRSDLTGSVASVAGKNVEGFKSASVVSALAGQVAGVQITQEDGTPGAGIDVKIRGVGTLTGDASPLYIVDGFQVGSIDYLSNSDIENIEILKDASASAIYGSRAANGVVLVTTKSGKVGRPTVTINSSSTYRTISKTLDVLSPYEFVKLQMDINAAKYADSYFKAGNDADGVPYRYQTIDDYIGVAGIDWQAEAFNPTWSFDNNVSVQGGNNDTKYSLAVSNFNENGIFANSGFDKTAVKLRVNQKINKRVTVDATVNYVFSDKRGVGTSADDGRFNMLAQILRARPTGGLSMTDEELRYAALDPLEVQNENNLAQVNPIVQAESVDNSKKSEMWQANVSASVVLTKNLTFRSAGSYYMNTSRRDIFYRDGSKEAYRNGQSPYGESTAYLDRRMSNNNYLTHIYKTRKHRVETMLGQEIVYNTAEYLTGQSRGFITDILGNNNLGLGATPTVVNSSYADKMLISFFGRVNYNFSDRILATATLRNDGSSVFSSNHKWAWSPSASVAWRVSEEKFLKPVRTISNLKVRVGWGVVGNDRIANYLSLPLYNVEKYGANGGLNTVLVNKHLPNQDIKWEGSSTTNVGIDLSLFKNRINLTADAFIKNTKDLLMAKSLPFASGFESQYRNIGKIRNKGIELTLNSVNLQTKSGLMWRTDFNISFIRNTLVALEQGQKEMFDRASYDINITSYDYVARVGESLGLMYGYVFDGVYQSSDFNVNASTGGLELKPGVADLSKRLGRQVEPGVVKYKDINGDGVISDADRTVIGNGIPKLFGGISNTVNYKNIDFSFMLQYCYGNDIYNATRLFMTQPDLERYNMMGDVADRWSATNASKDMHSTKGYIRNDVTSRYIEDGSFLRLKNITLGYTLPRKWTSKLYIDRARVYTSAQNLWTLTNYSGYDPEVSMRASNPMTPGVDWGAYPKSKVFTFGIDVQF